MAARKFGRSLVVAGILTAVVVPATAGAAYADNPHPAPAHHGTTQAHMPPQHGNTPGHQPSQHRPAPASVVATKVRNAEIRTSTFADRHARTVDVLRRPGSRVQVLCYQAGQRIGGNAYWYKTVTPSRGFISAASVSRPSRPVSRCA
jgi:hypothetical protein